MFRYYLHETCVFALYPDHGHIATDPARFMDLDKRGGNVKITSNDSGLEWGWHSILKPAESYRVSKGLTLNGSSTQANVVLVPTAASPTCTWRRMRGRRIRSHNGLLLLP